MELERKDYQARAEGYDCPLEKCPGKGEVYGTFKVSHNTAFETVKIGARFRDIIYDFPSKVSFQVDCSNQTSD